MKILFSKCLSPENKNDMTSEQQSLQNDLASNRSSYLSTHTVYQYKINFFHYFGGIWPYWKMDTEKHNFHELLLLF